MIRWCTVLSAAAAAILSSFAIYFNIVALAKYRTDDFLTATSTVDFTTKGTCVEVITAKQLKNYGYGDDLEKDNGCDDDVNKGLQREMARTLAVSVHSIYHAYFTLSTDDWAVRTVAKSVLTATIPPSDKTVVPPVNFSLAYQVLRRVAEQTIPIGDGCKEIYNIPTEKYMTEDDAKTYLARLREHKYNDKGEETAAWPILDIPVACNEAAPTRGNDTIDLAVPLSTLQKEKLYAHCLAQFYFASSGTSLDGGTFGVPLVGERPGPKPGYFYPKPSGFDANTTDYSKRTRLFLGQRFGYSVWAYVPMMLATCYLCADAVVFFLAEATLPFVREDTQSLGGSRLAMKRDSLVMAATSGIARSVRFTYGATAVAASWAFYRAFVIEPWGYGATRMGRPICEADDPQHTELAMYQWIGTHGGWRADRDATWYEQATLFTQICVLLFLPFTTFEVFKTCNKCGMRRNRQVVGASLPEKGMVSGSEKQTRLMTVFIFPFLGGAVAMIVGQAVSGAQFGMAWAEGVIGRATITDDDTGAVSPAFNEVTLSEQIYNQTISILALTIAIGLVLGVVLQRHLFNGTGCSSSLLFFAWVGLIILFALPLLAYAGVRSVFNQDEANEDCGAFTKGYGVAKETCRVRFWTFLSGAAGILLTLALMTIFGLRDALLNLRAVRKRIVVVTSPEVLEESSAFDATRSSKTTAPFVNPGFFDPDKHSLGGYRSGDESFFNYKTSIPAGDNGESNRLLYAPRVSFSLPVPAAR